MVKKTPNSKSTRQGGSKGQLSNPARSTPTESESAPPPAEVPPEELKLQQTLLNVFSDAFRDVLSSDSFNTVLQEIKSALYSREFSRAFGSAEYLDVYAARWSPTRALCYARILEEIGEHLGGIVSPLTSENGDDDDDDGAASQGDGRRRKRLRVLAMGGGPAELAALGSYLHLHPSRDGDITMLDTGPWGDIVTRLHTGLTTPPVLSKFASTAAKAANEALITTTNNNDDDDDDDASSSRRRRRRLVYSFAQCDILALDHDELKSHLILSPPPPQQPLLVTLLFTLNELYTSSGIGPTTAFLRRLTSCIPTGSLLLVVDSPGSYSEAAVGREQRRYPMQWLLDHTLLTENDDEASSRKKKGAGEGPQEEEEQEESDGRGCKWEKIETQDSSWFRLSEALRYPIALENMRYQLHLYRATARDAD